MRLNSSLNTQGCDRKEYSLQRTQRGTHTSETRKWVLLLAVTTRGQHEAFHIQRAHPVASMHGDGRCSRLTAWCCVPLCARMVPRRRQS